ncbi:MAG: CpaF family protein, partial [Halobacteriovoraceae bacterium]|nr:CpaF family protein [Halobacteriovoraceae bacterium]
CLMGDTKIPPDAMRKMVASAMQIIVQCSRYHDGGRRISCISEVLYVDDKGNYVCRDIFRWLQKDKTEDGKYIGEIVPCNYIPSFFEEIVINKLPFPKKKFSIPDWASALLKKAS